MTQPLKLPLFVLATALSLTLGSSATAQLLVYEGFDYTDGQTIIGANGGVGFDVPWTDDIGGGSEAANITAVLGSLADPNGVLPTSGNAVSLQGAGGNVRLFRTINTASPALAPFVTGGEIGADGTTIYLSVLSMHGGGGAFMDDPPILTQTNFLELGTGTLNSAANGAFVVGIDAAGGSPETRAVTEKADQNDFVSIGDTSFTPDLVVMKIDFAAGEDTLSVFVNPTSDTIEPTPDGTIMGDFEFNRIGLGAFQASLAGIYDEFRIAGSYADIFTLPTGETIPGDADNDGDVDLNDYFAIRDNFFSTVDPIGGIGDVSGGGFDGVVNLQDYVIWKREFEMIGGVGTAPSLFGVVPEPSSLVLLGGCLAFGAVSRRKSRS